MSLAVALGLVALVLALVEEFRTHGQDLIGWAVVCLAAIYVVNGL